MPYKQKLFICLFLGLLALVTTRLTAQEKTKAAIDAPPAHSVGRAAIYSAVLPGLGQAYNRKYWKIPIIYAGFTVLGYFVVTNDKEYDDFKEAYVYVANGDTTPTDNPYVTKYTKDQLNETMQYYRRNRDLSIIIGALWYTLNILEAYVDAHFFDYDISEDLTLRVSPAAVSSPFKPVQAAPGIRLTLKF
jgi:hypothetical protein